MSDSISKSPIIKLGKYLGKKVQIEVVGKTRQINGHLKSFDKYSNMIITDAEETVQTSTEKLKRTYKSIYVRGDVVTLSKSVTYRL